MKKVLLVLTLSLLTIFAQARKFYISSSTGDDSKTYLQAQNQLTPWKSLKTVTCFGSALCNQFQCFGSYPNRAAAGDTFAFKRGDLFDNGWNYYSSFLWLNYAVDGYSCPSGTASNPIVFTNYGNDNLPLPNLLYPSSTIPSDGFRQVFELGGVSFIIIDGLQFNENRGTLPQADKITPSPSRGAIWLGTSVFGCWADTNIIGRIVKDCEVKNCYFNNVSFAIGSLAGIRCNIHDNVIVNLKACTDTIGVHDVGAGAFEGLNGYFNRIHHNYVRGAWAKSGRVSSTLGLLGVGCDIFNLKYSNISYNTFIDCSGTWEIGNLDYNVDPTSGAQYDTFSYNKSINCGQFGYIHGNPGDPFQGAVKNIYCWNNVIINNNTSRMSGPNFGYDMYGDGQSFRGNSAGQYAWWFFRSPTKCPDANLPPEDQSWSNPINPPYCNYGGHRLSAQYGSDDFPNNPDTIVDYRNNIFYATTGDQMIYDITRTKQKHRNNIYYIKGSFLNPTTLGGTLNTTAGATEYQTTTKLFVDTSSAFPENWDLHLATGSLAIGKGVVIPQLTKDFAGVTLSGIPDVGLYKYSATPILILNSSTNITCKTATNGSFIVSASGGTVPYKYKVNNSLYTTTTTYSNLAPATYTVTVKDSKGLLSTINVTVKSSNITCP